MIVPMLAKDPGEKPPRVPREKGYVIEPKFDGVRWIMERTEKGIRHWSGRNGRQVNNVSESQAAIGKALMYLPVGTVLDSELVSADGGHRGRKAVKKIAYVFDVLRVEGENVMPLMWHQRRELFLEPLAEGFDTDVVQLVPFVDGTWEEQQAVHEKWLGLGMEGSIAKKKVSVYKPGSRTRAWLKIKPQETAEAVVIGFKMGEGQDNQDEVGALKIRLLDTDGETSCAWMGHTPEEAKAKIGKIVEIRHHGWMDMKDGEPAPGSVVQHPIKHRWREDRDE